MKEKDKKTLLVGAGAVALLGLAVYASRGSGRDEPLNLGGGGGVAGGGMPAVLAGGVDGTGEGTGQGEVTYNVAFPDVQVPAMPAIPVSTDPLRTTKKGFIPANIPGNDTGKSYSMTVMGPAKTVSDLNTPESRAAYSAVMGPAKTESDLNTPESRAAYSAVVASGIPGGSSTKKGAAVGRDTAPGGLPGLIGGLVGGIGGLFGW